MARTRLSVRVGILVAIAGGLACDDRTVPASMEEAIPLDEFLPCATDEDCVVVQSSCNGCCQQTAVNRRSSEAYGRYRGSVCAGYFGVVCSCRFKPVRSVCRANICTLEATDGG